MSQAPKNPVAEDPLAIGMDFLVAAVHDLADDVLPSRHKFGLVNLATGIEILFKVRLAREHWSIVFRDVNQADRSNLETGDFISVDPRGAIKRLRSICAIQFTQEQEQALNVIRAERNKVIHMGYVGQQTRLRPVAAKALVFMISFISEELEPSGLTEDTNILLEEIRGGLTRIQTYVTERRISIQSMLAASYSPIVQCPLCLEEAMTLDGDRAKCEFCGLDVDGESAADMFAHNVLELSKYRVVTQGGEWPVHQCPECGRSAFVEGVKGRQAHMTRWICFSCGIEAENKDVWPCVRCYEPVITADGPPAFCDMCSYR